MKTTTFRFAALAAAAVAAVASIFACSRSEESPDTAGADISGAAVGQIRGTAAISAMLRTRMLDDTDSRSASFAVESVGGGGIFQLRSQLGAFSAAGTQTAFQGGTPTPFNMALWHQLFARFGDAMGEFCTSGGTDVTFTAYGTSTSTFPVSPSIDGGARGRSFRLFPTVAQKITDACTFQGDETARRATASALFDAVMGRGGSLADDKASFLTTFAADGSSFVSAAPNERVSSMFVAMLLNPHFLLSN
jgi:hypothetical protein